MSKRNRPTKAQISRTNPRRPNHPHIEMTVAEVYALKQTGTFDRYEYWDWHSQITDVEYIARDDDGNGEYYRLTLNPYSSKHAWKHQVQIAYHATPIDCYEVQP